MRVRVREVDLESRAEAEVVTKRTSIGENPVYPRRAGPSRGVIGKGSHNAPTLGRRKVATRSHRVESPGISSALTPRHLTRRPLMSSEPEWPMPAV